MCNRSTMKEHGKEWGNIKYVIEDGQGMPFWESDI